MTNRTASGLLLIAISIAAALSLTGCSQIADTLHKVHEESFADRAAAEQGWQGVAVPAWIPEDSTDIHNLATTDETNAVILVRSPSDLPAGCVEAERKAIPFESPGWAPKLDRFPDTVHRCGDYEVVAADDGWFGWFSATTEGQTPTPAVTAG